MLVNLYIFLFVSELTKQYFPDDDPLLVILLIVLLVFILFAAKAVLEVLIPDEEAWVTDDKKASGDLQHRVVEGIQKIKLGHYVKSV